MVDQDEQKKFVDVTNRYFWKKFEHDKRYDN